jgi:acetolactate decarboxylase
MIHEGRIEARVAITEIARPHVYAVGALAGMEGEVAIVDGAVWIARGDARGGAAVAGPTDEHAALLVAATVPAWTTVRIETDIPFEQLDARLEEYARRAGLDVERPFPFVFEGSLVDVRWHVLTGPPSPGASPHDHTRNAIIGERAEMNGVAVGFFSKHHQGVFTHMGQNVHAHVVDAPSSLVGHADTLSIRAGSVLRLPRTRVEMP